MNAQLWLAEVSDATAGAEDGARRHAELAAQLSPSERARLQRFGRPARRAQFLAAHRLLRVAIAAYCGRPVDAVVIDQSPEGQPRVVHPAAVSVSLAHSGAWVAALVQEGTAPVGVDIERIRAERDMIAIAAAIGLPAASTQAAYRNWVVYEAALKAAQPAAEHAWSALWRDLAIGVAGLTQPPEVRWVAAQTPSANAASASPAESSSAHIAATGLIGTNTAATGLIATNTAATGLTATNTAATSIAVTGIAVTGIATTGIATTDIALDWTVFDQNAVRAGSNAHAAG